MSNPFDVSRLKIPVDGGTVHLFTASRELIARGHQRVVIGGRGPYVELTDAQIAHDALAPTIVPHFCFTEWRTRADNVKIYDQRRRVDYADYRPGLFYVSPFELFLPDGTRVIEPLPRGDTRQAGLFDEGTSRGPVGELLAVAGGGRP